MTRSSPAQLRNIEEAVKVKCWTAACSSWTFASRHRPCRPRPRWSWLDPVPAAKTERYVDPSGRIKGGIGMRSAGEKEIETDRRVAQQTCWKELRRTLTNKSHTQRKNRGEFIRVALVGYTNVGEVP